MKRSTLFPPIAALFVATLLIVSCTPAVKIVGSGNLVTDTPAIDGFTQIDASHTFKVTITRGSEFKVGIRADDNVMPLLDIKKSGDTLNLGFKDGDSYSLKNVTLEANVTMPKLNAIDLSGISRATFGGFESTDDFKARLSGASKLSGNLVCGDVNLQLSGASFAELRGSGKDLRVEVSGASSAILGKLATANGHIEASGASQVTADVRGTLNAEASGASKITYSGNPKIGSIKTSGAAKIEAN